MKILIDHEYGYEYYLWEVDAESSAVYEWFAKNHTWYNTCPTVGMQSTADDLSVHHKIETLSSARFLDILESKDYDARVHWHEEEDSYIHK